MIYSSVQALREKILALSFLFKRLDLIRRLIFLLLLPFGDVPLCLLFLLLFQGCVPKEGSSQARLHQADGWSCGFSTTRSHLVLQRGLGRMRS